MKELSYDGFYFLRKIRRKWWKRERWVVIGGMRKMTGNRAATINFSRNKRRHNNLEERGKL